MEYYVAAAVAALALIALPAVVVAAYDLYNAFIYIANGGFRDVEDGECRWGKLTIVTAIYREPMGLVLDAARRVNNIASAWRGGLEWLIVSDDEEGYVKELDNRLREVLKVKYRIIRRANPTNGKGGALDYATRFIDGEYVLLMDVDSRIDPSFIIKACGRLKGNTAAVVGRWYGYNYDTPVAKAITSTMVLAVNTIQAGRRLRGLPALVTGTGTVIRVDALKAVDGWAGSGPQDDVYIWLKLLSRGFDVDFIDDAAVGVENPRTYTVFKFQQVKWAYGIGDALRRGWVYVRPLRPRVKADVVLTLLQYPLSSLVFVSILAMGVLSPILRVDLGLPLLPVYAAYGALVAAYGYLYTRSLHGAPYYDAGRASAIMASIMLMLLASFLRGLLGFRPIKWSSTPKGGLTVLKLAPYETLILAASLALFALNLTYLNLWASVELLSVIVPLAYVHVRFGGELLGFKLI